MKATTSAIHPEPKLQGQRLMDLLPSRANPLTGLVKIHVQDNTVQKIFTLRISTYRDEPSDPIRLLH